MKRFLEITSIAFIFICFITIVQSCKKLTLPVVTTLNVTGFTATSAESGGNVINNGGAEVIARGVCWSTSKEPTINSNPNITSDGRGNGAFTSNITGLKANTLYYVGAYATNSEGTGYGDSKNFKTHCDSPSAPIVGTITQPTCSATTGSVVLSGLPEAGPWTLTRTPGGTTYSQTGTSYTVTGLPAGTTYTFTVTNASDCVSAASGNVVINTQPATPSAPVVGAIAQPTCADATGSVTLSGLPSTGTWTLTRTPGGTTTTGTGTSKIVSGLPAATTYIFTVTNVSGCISAASGNVVINTQAATSSAPVVGTTTQPTCAVATGSVALSGLPSTGTWTLTRTPGGTTITGTGTSTTVSGLPAGTTYTFTVTNALDCVSAASGNVFINTQPAIHSAPVVGTITQPTCAIATGSVVLSGLPSTGTGTLTRTPGGTTYSQTGTSYTVTGLPAGTTYTFTVTNASGCVSAASGNVVINTQPATPSAPVVGTITQPTCAVATGSVVISGLPSIVTWILTRTPSGTTYSYSGTSYIVTGLPAGTTYTFTVENASGCVSVSSGSVVISAQPTTPSVTTNAATSLANTTAILNGTVNSYGCSTVVTFDYGLTTSYGFSVTASQSPINGSGPTNVNTAITELSSGQIYHYRVKAVSNGITTYGEDLVFTTTVNDRDGNDYNTVAIGTQVWMKENLKTTKYKDGTTISYPGTDNTAWQNNLSGAYAWYDNDESTYKNPYGALYNWYAVNTNKLCPAGWHVPSQSEWHILNNFLGWDVAGLKLKESGTIHWQYTNYGATNETGFTAVGTGIRSTNGSYTLLNGYCYCWLTNEIDITTAQCMLFAFDHPDVMDFTSKNNSGCTVRCLRDY